MSFFLKNSGFILLSLQVSKIVVWLDLEAAAYFLFHLRWLKHNILNHLSQMMAKMFLRRFQKEHSSCKI